VESGAGFLKFQGMKFRDGLLEKVLPLNAVTSKDVRPTFEDITLFGESPGFDKAVIREWKIDEAVAALRVHDRVEVIEGELKGLIGAVVDINGQDNTVQVLPHSTTNALLEEDPRPLSIAAYHIRKAFEIGDYIQVRHGAYAGKRGHIVDVQLETETLEFVEFDNTATATGSILVHEDHLLNFQSSKAIIGDHVQIRRGVHVGKMGRILRIFEASGLVQIAVHYDSESNLDVSCLHAHCICNVTDLNWKASASSYHVQMFNVNFVRNDQAASLADPAATAVTTNLSDPEVTDGLCQGVPVVNQATVSKKVRDPMAGRQVLVVGKSLYSGYYGTIQYTHEHLKHYSVCLEATGRVVQIGEGFIVDRQCVGQPYFLFSHIADHHIGIDLACHSTISALSQTQKHQYCHCPKPLAWLPASLRHLCQTYFRD
jgi:ribosomal protein L24